MHFLKSSAIALLSISGILALSACNAEEPAKNVAVVNGVPIPQARLDFVAKMQMAQGQKDGEDFRKQIREALITREIISQEAIKIGLDKRVDYQTQIDLASQQVLVATYLEDYLKNHEPSDEDLKKEYEKVKTENFDPNGKEYKTRHILIKKEADAKAVMAMLAKGAKFEDVAKKKSEDAGSKVKGGELDWSDGSNLAKPFAEAVKALKKGEMTKAPVQTQYGFHIIRLDDVRDQTFPPYEQVKEEVAKQLISRQRDELIDGLRKGAKVE